MNKRLWFGLVIIVLIFFASAICYKDSSSQEKIASDYVNKLNSHAVITKDNIIKAREKTDGKKLSATEQNSIIADHTIGKKDSKVVVVEYEDFACVHCQEFHGYMNKIQEDYQDRVLFIFRAFSLGYPNSLATISAAEAAGKVGGNPAYWAMNKQLFATDKWVGYAVPDKERKNSFNQYAKNIGIDANRFNEELSAYKSNGIQDKIDRDKNLAKKDGVTGTPTWLINGKKIEKLSDDQIRKELNEALDKNK